ncbi:MAG TPA: hypothetical protein VK326_08340 [Solirubrobacterales bacterium]|nr:hypothetical protein [Solirubrobacterales bacterium]
MKMRKLRPSPGALIGTIALVFAFTGAAVAAEKIQTNDIAGKAVTGKKIARDAVKSGKIRDGGVKAQDLADNVLPFEAYGRVNKAGATVTVGAGATGITAVSDGGPGVVCYDLADVPTAGTANAVIGGPVSALVEVQVTPNTGCPAPFNDASTVTRNSATGNPIDRDLYVHFIG